MIRSHPSGTVPAAPWGIACALGALGAVSLAAQVLLLRAFLTVFLGSELTIGTVLALWMVLTALGAWGGGRLGTGTSPSLLAVLQLLTALLIPLSLFAVRSVRALWGALPGETLGLVPLFLTAAVALAPLCIALGMQFPGLLALLATSTGRPGRRFVPVRGRGSGGWAYALESAGAMVGGIALTFLLIPRLDPFRAAVLLSLIEVLSALPAAAVAPGRHPRYALLAALAAGGILYGLSDRVALLSRTIRWKGLSAVAETDSPYGNIVVARERGQVTLFENGLLSYSSEDDPSREESVHLPFLFVPEGRKVLVVGLTAAAVEEVLKHPVSSVECVESDPRVLETLSPFLPDPARRALGDRRVTLHAMDPRRYLAESQEDYNLILVDVPFPVTAVLNRFFTIEFFREAGRHLAPGGVLSLGLPSSDAYIGREMRLLSASVYRALTAAFPFVRPIPGERTYLIASYSPGLMAPSPRDLALTWARQRIPSRFMTPSFISYRLSEARAARVMNALDSPAPLNSDLRPVSYLYGLLLVVSQFSPAAAGALEDLTRSAPWALIVPLLVLPFLGFLLPRRARGVSVIGIVGFAGMALEIVLIYSFQSLYGYVYRDIGLLMALFMGGLSLGVLAGARSRSRGLAPVLVRLSLFSLLLPPCITVLRGILSPVLLPGFYALFGTCGYLTGRAFSPADTGYAAGRRTAAVYAADVAGGAAGALLTGLILVPFFGVLWVSVLVGGVCFSGFILQRSAR